MILAHPLPWWMLVGLVVGAAALAYLVYRFSAVSLSGPQRIALMGLRFLTLLLVLVCLLGPMMADRSVRVRDAVVPILIDASRSMRLADADGGTRMARAAEVVQGPVVSGLAAEFRVETLSFGEIVTPGDVEQMSADARRTDIAGAIEAVRERYRGQTVAGIVLISDGGDTGGEDAATSLGSGVGPVYTVGVGSPEGLRDREVVSVTAGEAALSDSVVDLGVSVVSHGYGTDPIEVRVLENGRPIQVERLTPSGDGAPLRAVFQVSPVQDAATVYSVEIPVDATDLVPENNAQQVLIRPPGRRRRVLLVEGAPGYEHSFLARALAEDPGIELDSVVRKGHNDRGQATFYVQGARTRAAALAGGYPVTREALFGYDAVILANIEGQFFSAEQLRLTADFVSTRGGGLLVMGARSFAQTGLSRTPLEEVLPVELTDRGGDVARAAATDRGQTNKPVLTEDGEGHPVMQLGVSPEDSRRRWAAAPALASTFLLGAPRPGGSVLAISPAPGGLARPLVAVQRYGRGRSMIFAGEASWRWRMMLPSSDRTYETFWRQAVRWLATAAPDPLTLTASGGTMLGESVAVNVVARNESFEAIPDASIEVRVTGPAGDRILRPSLEDSSAGRYSAGLSAEAAGIYRLQTEVRRGGRLLGTAEEWLLVGGADVELADPRRNDQVLRRVADASGGRSLEANDLSALPELLRQYAPEPAPPGRHDVWNAAWVLGLIILLLAGEWGLRRHVGLR